MRRDLIVLLAPQVVALFESMRQFSGADEIVFPGNVSGAKRITENTLLKTPRRPGYGKEEMCIHGFRSMASTLLNGRGYNRNAIELQLARSEQNRIGAAYNRAQWLKEQAKKR